MTEESAPDRKEQADSAEDATAAGAVRHEVLLAKVREANKRSLAPQR
ncbi:hypothetical protein [Streptomyces vinaceus]